MSLILEGGVKFDSALAASLQHSSKAVSNPCNASNHYFILRLTTFNRLATNELLAAIYVQLMLQGSMGCGSARNDVQKQLKAAGLRTPMVIMHALHSSIFILPSLRVTFGSQCIDVPGEFPRPRKAD